MNIVHGVELYLLRTLCDLQDARDNGKNFLATDKLNDCIDNLKKIRGHVPALQTLVKKWNDDDKKGDDSSDT